MVVIWEVSHNDGSMIKDFVLKVLTRLHLDFLVLEPDIPEAFPQDLDLSRGADFDICEGLSCSLIQRGSQRGINDVYPLDCAELYDFLLCDIIWEVEEHQLGL